jgi:transcriptional regulator with XRE-family HTH domain
MQTNNTIKINEKIKFIRSLKSWTQEQVADKLGITTHAYAKIERGETDVNFSRLEQIAEVMGIDLLQLLSFDEKNIFNFNKNHSQSHIVCQVNSSMQQSENKHELEKANLIIEQLKKEVEYLNQNNEFIKQQLQEYREIINILKGNHQ